MEKYMKLAIEKAKEGIIEGQTPFGATIVLNDEVIAVAHNTVWKDTNITAHAEINAIKEACKKINSIDLSGATIYSTCEPCPMCFAACHWAKISKIVYGAWIRDAKSFGFQELMIYSQTLKELGNISIAIEQDMLREDCVGLFEFWKEKMGKSY
jgi:tRNA(Arg) A34 adenosine deaminase TadA